MSGFPNVMGTLKVGGRQRTYNRPTVNQKKEEISLEEQYEKAKDPDEKHQIFLRAKAEHDKNKIILNNLIC